MNVGPERILNIGNKTSKTKFFNNFQFAWQFSSFETNMVAKIVIFFVICSINFCNGFMWPRCLFICAMIRRRILLCRKIFVTTKEVKDLVIRTYQIYVYYTATAVCERLKPSRSENDLYSDGHCWKIGKFFYFPSVCTWKMKMLTKIDPLMYQW